MDGSMVNKKDLDYKLIKPLIWWDQNYGINQQQKKNR